MTIVFSSPINKDDIKKVIIKFIIKLYHYIKIK